MKREEMHKGQRLFVAEIGEDLDTSAVTGVIVREYKVTKLGEVQYELTPVKGGMTQGGWWRNTAFHRKCFLTPEEAVADLGRRLRDTWRAEQERVNRLGKDTAKMLQLILAWQEEWERERDVAEEDPNAHHDA